MNVVSLPLIPKGQCRLEKLNLYLANKDELGLSGGVGGGVGGKKNPLDGRKGQCNGSESRTTQGNG